MRFAPKSRVQRAVVAGVVAFGLLGATGSAPLNEQSTTRSVSLSDGVMADVGPVKLRNVLIAATSDTTPGAVLGTAFNTSNSAVQLNLTGTGGTVDVTVPANGSYQFGDQKGTVFTRAGAKPGALADVTAKVNSAQETMKVPVLDGALTEYQQYLPTTSPSAAAATGAPAAPTATATQTTVEPNPQSTP